MGILAFVLSMASLLCIIISALTKGKNMKLILMLVAAANILTALSYMVQVPMAVNGSIACFVGAAMSVINYFFDRDNKPVPKWLLGKHLYLIKELKMHVHCCKFMGN